MKRGEVTPERLALAAEVRRLRDEEGLFFREITAELGISHSYAESLYSDPDGAKARARKDRYRGECVDCGRPTSGAMGRKAAPERCADCAHALQHQERRWTRESVIDAIQRFARANGRPPLADEWIKGDQANEYPPRSRVYGRREQPFVRWADAIEASGFERPLTGRYVRRPRKTTTLPRKQIITTKGRLPVRDYIVLELDNDGRWIQHETVESYSEALAIEKHVEGLAPVNGKASRKFVAISTARWIVRELQPVTSFKAVTSAPEVKKGKAARRT